MTWFIGQSIVIIAVAFLLGVLVGWLLWGRLLRGEKAAAPAAVPAAEQAIEEKEAEPAEAEPQTASEAVSEPERATDAEPEPVAVGNKAQEPEVVAEPEPASNAEPEPELVAVVEPESAAEATAEPEPAAVEIPVQATAPEAEAVEDDNLQRIEGIGPKMEAALHTAGLRTWAQVADADETQLRAAIKAAGLRFAPSIVTWARQARMLADGDHDGHADLTRRLVAGRDEGRE
ncbi:helix-hairpin-helix domain-containing protein [Hamadaea sp.]|uniref:helix-hairpin-helix domain-containing protein n=1 Tax=Hamadaea sp. TaxID=2024425 RepID=UPI0025BEF253|nr:helix-hairpin-helix domain-containing protein [Hamadaea sp.]